MNVMIQVSLAVHVSFYQYQIVTLARQVLKRKDRTE